MAGNGRNPSDDGNSKDTIEKLETDFQVSTDKIRAILKDKNDKRQLGDEDKRALRLEYSTAAGLAKQVADRCTDDRKRDAYREAFKKLSDTAKSYGSVLKSEIPSTRLDDVKGLGKVKEVIKTFLFMAKHPEILTHYKVEGGLGMLMYGAPGTGKTMIAKAIANEMQMPLFIVTPADIFKSYVGESEQSVRQIFDELDACRDGGILFVDECESIFSRRSQDTKDYKSAVTTELLQRIDGIGTDGSKRILIGATNRPDLIDEAYLRYKRFSHLIHVGPPDAEAKRAIFASKLEGIACDGVSLEDLLAMTEAPVVRETEEGAVGEPRGYYSSADICGIVEEACRIAIGKMIESNSTDAIALTLEMFQAAFDKVPPSIPLALLRQYERFRGDVAFA